MRKVKLRGEDAISYAREHGLRVNKAADATEGERQGLSVDEAERIVERDPTLIWIEITAGVNPAD